MKNLKRWGKVTILTLCLTLIVIALSSMSSLAAGQVTTNISVSKDTKPWTFSDDAFCIQYGKNIYGGVFVKGGSYSLTNKQKYIIAKYHDLIKENKYSDTNIKRGTQVLLWHTMGTAGKYSISGDAKTVYSLLNNMANKESANFGKEPVSKATTTVKTEYVDNASLKGYKVGPFKISHANSLGNIGDLGLWAGSTSVVYKIMDEKGNVITDWKEKYEESYKGKEFYVFVDEAAANSVAGQKLEFKVKWTYASDVSAEVYSQAERNRDGSYKKKNGDYIASTYAYQKVIKSDVITKDINLTFDFNLTDKNVFMIDKINAATGKEAKATKDDPFEFTVTTDAKGLENFKVQAYEGYSMDTEFPLEKSGTISFKVSETKTPKGYTPLQGTIEFVIERAADGKVSIKSSNIDEINSKNGFTTNKVNVKCGLTLSGNNVYINLIVPNSREIKKGNFSGYVWVQDSKMDTNMNYILDNGDARLGGVLVRLYKTGDSNIIATTNTDANGYYEFKDIALGYWDANDTWVDSNNQYYVTFEYNGEEYMPIPRVAEVNKLKENYSKSMENATDRIALNNKINGLNASEMTPGYYIDEGKTKVPVYKETKIVAQAYKYALNATHVNLGLMKRPKADLALQKDIVDVTLKINGKEETYKYDYKVDDKGNEYFEVELKDNSLVYGAGTKVQVTNNKAVTIKDNGVIDTSEYLRQSDEAYKINTYKDVDGQTHAQVLGATADNELKIDLRYRISVRNQGTLAATVQEIVDYYDSSKMRLKEVRDDKNNVIASDFKTEKHGDYQKNYIKSLENVVIDPSQTKTLYFVFEMLKNDDREILISDKNNYAEINKFTTYIPEWYENTVNKYMNGADLKFNEKPYLLEKDPITASCIKEWIGMWRTSADANGKITFGSRDIDSTPGNYMPELDYKKDANGKWSAVKDGKTYYFEDDNDKAPVFRIKVMPVDMNRKLSGNVWEDIQKDGLRQDNKDLKLAGIKVELIEMTANEGAFVYATTRTDANGYYTFKDFIPGNYVVRFTYGGSTYVIDAANNVNYDNLKNLLSMKTVDNQNVLTAYTGQDYKSVPEYKDINTATANIDIDSNAKDNDNKRAEVNEFSRNVSNALGEILDVGSLVSGVEYDANGRVTKVTKVENADNLKTFLDKTSMQSYTATMGVQVEESLREHVDLGLVERDRFSVELEKRISGVRYTPEGYEPYEVAVETDENGMLVTDTGAKKMAKQGGLYLIQINEELMQGNLQVEYTISAKNTSNVVGSVDKVIDYVDFADNTMAYKEDAKMISGDTNKSNAEYWNKVEVAKLEENGVNKGIATELSKDDSKYKDRIYLMSKDEMKTSLAAGESKTIAKLLVSKQTVKTNSNDELTASNTAEVVQYSNSEGRRDYLSVPGNYNPATEEVKSVLTDRAYEPDTSSAATLSIIPPLGDSSIPVVYIAIGAIALATLGGVVFLVKKKLL